VQENYSWLYQVDPEVHSGEVQGRPYLTTPQGGKVVVDQRVLSLWRQAQTKEFSAIMGSIPEAEADEVRAMLACLVQAGLLHRQHQSGRAIVTNVVGSENHFLRKEDEGTPLVSAVIVSHNNLEWLDGCLNSLLAQDYPKIEIILVDNASEDETTAWVKTHFPSARTIRLDRAVPFAEAVNTGVEQVRISEQRDNFLLLLNPDITMEVDAVRRMVEAAGGEKDYAAVGGKLRFMWAPSFLNGLGNRVGAFSWGTDNALGHLDLGQFDHWQELPSACFAAVLISRFTWDCIGSVDVGFSMYYEDTEWCYRARLMGFHIRAAPQAVFYHAFGGRVPDGEDGSLPPSKLRHVVYGRLRFTIKLLQGYLLRFLLNYLVEDIINLNRSMLLGRWANCRAYLLGWADLIKTLPELLQSRRQLQKQRIIPDEHLFSLQNNFPETIVWHGLPELTWDVINQHYRNFLLMARIKKMLEFSYSHRSVHLLIVSHDVVAEKMAGPGVRYLEMARALSKSLDVTLAVPSESKLKFAEINIVRYWEDRPGSLQVLVENADVVLVSGYLIEKFPLLEHTTARLVVDLYDPFVLENLYYYINEPLPAQMQLHQKAVSITNRLAMVGDFFICGNERQRDYWLGVLSAGGRANPLNFRQDQELRKLIDIVGVGFPEHPPRSGMPLRGVHPLVSADSRIVLWGGGIWNWLDPLTLIHAWPSVISRFPQARLIFLGTRHPNPLVPAHQIADQALSLADEIGEKDHSIIFFEWLSYEEREALLCEADVGVILHPIHVETRYSIRTRVLDYIWARLPILITEGDVTSEWVQQFGLGEVVPEKDVELVAEALCRLLAKPKVSWSSAFDPLHQKLTWSQVVSPLLHYCQEGGYAPDRMERGVSHELPSLGPGELLARGRYIWRVEGKRAFLHRLWRYLQWRLSRA
jgi:GT2 family glycosyltransferase